MSALQVDQRAVEQEREFRRCAVDFVYFLENYWTIKEPGKKPHVISLCPAQKEIAATYAGRLKNGTPKHEQMITLKARQLGWTTITTAYAFWTVFFNEYLPWLFVSQNENYAIKNLTMVAFGYARLPDWMRDRGPTRTKNTTENIEFDNGSSIESIPATGSAGRGDAVWGVMWDETAFAPDAAAMYGALEPLCYGQMTLLSTANGMGNLFHDFWLDSEIKGSPWKGQFFPWNSRPGRDDAWYESQKRKYRGQMWLFHQEYPRNPIEAFAKSGRVVIDFDLLDEYDWYEAPQAYAWDFGAKEFEMESLDVEEREGREIVLEVWEQPTVFRDADGRASQAPNYVVAADVAEGLAHGDATYITVYNANTRECAAKIRTNYSADEVPDVLNWVGEFYFNAVVGVERNNHGWGILHALTRYFRYPRLYRMEQIAKVVQGDRTTTFGWHTNAGTKPKMVQDFVREMRDHGVAPRDPTLRHELNTFVQHDNGSYAANPPHHDDGVISHMIALQLMNDVGEYPIMWKDPFTNHPPTMFELDAMIDEMDRAHFNPLDTPIGGGEPKVGVTKSFWVAPTT
jgi:hypothetical protein